MTEELMIENTFWKMPILANQEVNDLAPYSIQINCLCPEGLFFPLNPSPFPTSFVYVGSIITSAHILVAKRGLSLPFSPTKKLVRSH